MPKILVADDNTNIQKMVSLAFEERGIDVVSVGNGEAAVRRIPDMKPDLVLADIFMPVRNGYEVCEFIKKDTRFSHVPVILLVGAFDPLDEKEARRVGADGVLKKPFVPPDPLIAMVISALEKNPKIAAEIAKAREASAAAPPPHDAEPLPALQMPARAEIKPLPEYPEPNSEEAALAYGYASKMGRGATEAGEQNPPISLEVDDVEQEEDNEQTSGAGGNWRRNAMDFEVPEETSKTTAFALDDDAAGMFPSERDVPPKHVSQKSSNSSKFSGAETTALMPGAPVKEPLAGPPVTAAASAVPPPPVASSGYVPPPPPPGSSLPLRSMPNTGTLPIESPLSTKSDITGVTATKCEAATVIAPAGDHPSEQKTESPADKIAKAVEALTVKPVDETTEAETFKAPVAKTQVSESPQASRAPHWMDAMKAALERPNVEAVALKTESKTAAIATSPVVEPAAHAVARVVPAAQEELSVVSEPLQPEADDAFFADESENASGWISVESAAPKTISQATNDPTLLETSEPAALGHIAADPELVAEVDTSGPITKDPALVVPPAVKVTPEPLLVDETLAAGPSDYIKKAEVTAAPFEFTEKPTASAAQEPVVDERIPTGLPPNKQALAEIPFLVPSPEFLQSAAETYAEKSEDHDVDALVRKVLEKLEPQLHNLLSEGVLKPLVANIIQGDLSKKES